LELFPEFFAASDRSRAFSAIKESLAATNASLAITNASNLANSSTTMATNWPWSIPATSSAVIANGDAPGDLPLSEPVG